MTIQNPGIITKIGLQSPKDWLGYRLTTKMVERTADHATTISRNVLLKNSKTKNFFKQFKK